MKVLMTLISVAGICWTQKINILYVNEIGNTIAEEALDVAEAYIKGNSKLGIQVDITKVLSNRTDSVELLESLCQTYSDMIDASKSPHLVLDTTMSGLASEVVKSFTAALALPTVTASFGQERDLIKWRNIDADEQKYLLQINPPADVIPELIRDIVVRQNITNAAILYDTSFVMDHKYKSLLLNIATRNVITAINQTRVGEQLKKLRSLDLLNFFILGRMDTIKNVLSIASKNSYFTKTYAWHAFTTDSGELLCDCQEGRVLYVKPIIVDQSSEEHLKMISTQYKLNSTTQVTSAFYFDLAVQSMLAIKSLMVSGSWEGDKMLYITCDDYNGTNTPKRTDLNLQSAFMKESLEKPIYGPFNIVTNGRSSMEFKMDLSIVQFRDGKIDKSSPVGTWDAGFGTNLTISNEDLMDNFTSAQVYRVVVAEQKPFIFKDPKHPKGYNGYCIDMMDKIAHNLGFEYEVQLATGNIIGQMDEQGKWNGMMKDLIDKKADIGLGSISVKAERENVVDFTVPYYDLVGYAIMLKSSYVPPSLFKFLSVLEDDVWICILCAYFITSFLLWLFDKYSPYSYQNNKEKYQDDEEKRQFTLRESFWFCMTSLTPQGGGEAPKNLSGRLVAATWWLFGFIIIASYTANLAAFLTVSRLEQPIESLDDLSKQYRVSYAPINGSDTMIYFERMANIESKFYEIWKDMSLNDSLNEVERAKLAVWDYPISDRFTKIWQAMQDTRLPTSLEEAARKVKLSKSATDGFALVGDATDIKYLELTNCDLTFVGEEFSMKPYALAVQQGSPLKEKLNNEILKLLNLRELEDIRIKWWHNNPEEMECPDPEDPAEGISAHNIGGVFIVIIAGIGIAFGTLTVEYHYFKKQRLNRVLGTPFRKENEDRESMSNLSVKTNVNLPAASRRMYAGAIDK